MMLAISRNSFHYKYCLTLRKMWGFNINESCMDRTSLCLYTQFLFWFSVVTVLSSPFILCGWFVLKIFRLLYKICSWTSIGRSIVDFLDKKGLGTSIDKASDMMNESPASTLVLTSIIFLLVVGVTSLVIFILVGGLLNIKLVLFFIAAIFLLLCLVVFYIFFGIGYALAHAWFITVIVAKAILGFVSFYIVAIGLIVGFMVAFSILSFISVKIISSSKTLTNFFGFKLNGYQAARANNSKRRKELSELHKKKAQEEENAREELKRAKARGEIPYTIFERILLSINRGLSNFFVARTKNVKGGSYRVMTGFGVVWETIKSLYHGVCPLVEIVDENNSEENE